MNRNSPHQQHQQQQPPPSPHHQQQPLYQHQNHRQHHSLVHSPPNGNNNHLISTTHPMATKLSSMARTPVHSSDDPTQLITRVPDTAAATTAISMPIGSAGQKQQSGADVDPVLEGMIFRLGWFVCNRECDVHFKFRRIFRKIYRASNEFVWLVADRAICWKWSGMASNADRAVVIVICTTDRL